MAQTLVGDATAFGSRGRPRPALTYDVLLNVGGATANHKANVVHVIDVPSRCFIGLRGLVLGVVGEASGAQHIDRKGG